MWKQSFTKGYIQQAFTRMCVSEALRHGEENAAYLQRRDVLRQTTGLGNVKVEREHQVRKSIRDCMLADANMA